MCRSIRSLLVVAMVAIVTAISMAQTPDSMLKGNTNAALIEADTASFLDKFLISELEKVQYARYSDSLKKQTLEELVKNQKLQNISLQQKLQNQQLKADSEKKQADTDLAKAEAERIKAEAGKQQELQNQKIRELQVVELQQRLTLENRTRIFLYFGLGFLAIFGLSLIRSNRQLKKRNIAIQQLSDDNILKEQEKQQILTTQNEVLERQIEKRTAELKASQNQLIQKEKLASLGELTAGIAHEIQNPLNFVNNFSELSAGLAEELKEELSKIDFPEQDKAYINDILSDLTSNQQKISHHGNRASNIVKNMLEHSRTSTGERTITDINKLVDEYMRLSYHGMRAKDKSFNAHFKMDLDKKLPEITIVSQDIGRVLLNLFNNAFYAVNDKSKQNNTTYTVPPSRVERDSANRTYEEEDKNAKGVYQPTVTATTSIKDNQIKIMVTDNGNGIPEALRQKIFQPFFTTKPTGQGTGLGLSLSYDIVVKGHGGIIDVNSTEGVGSEFIITLPLV